MITAHVRLAAPLAAALLFAACDQAQAPTAPPAAEPERRAAPRPTPASVQRTDVREAHEYRCDDGSRIHLSFLTDGVTAELRRQAQEPPLSILKAASAGEGFVRGGYRVDGTGEEISYVAVNQERQTCRR